MPPPPQVLILDWDVHHGNGTQDIFYADPSVMLIDVHQADVWPGSGGEGEAGEGARRGPVPARLRSCATQERWGALA